MQNSWHSLDQFQFRGHFQGLISAITVSKTGRLISYKFYSYVMKSLCKILEENSKG